MRILSLLLILAATVRANANTIVVTNTNETGAGSLDDAITSASSGDTITFNLTYPAIIALCGTLVISTNLTIAGPGAASLAISEGQDSTCSTGPVFFVSGGTVRISGLTIQYGYAPVPGGGDIVNYGTLALTACTVSYGGTEPGGSGGGINNSGILTLIDSTLSGNFTPDEGGGISSSGTLTVINSTFSGNMAAIDGAAIFSSGTLALINTTVSGNSQMFPGPMNGIISFDTLSLKNSILANNHGGNCPGTAVTSHGHNLSDDDTCAGLTGPGDLNNTSAGLDLAGLQYNGGPTQTIALLPTSPAVNAIPLTPINYCTALDGVTPIAADQRGVPRPQGPECDMGAFELAPTALCTGCYFFIQNERATFAFSSQAGTFSYYYRSSTESVQFVSTLISRFSVLDDIASFSGEGTLNGQSGFSFAVVAAAGGALGAGTVSINIIGPNNYSYAANGTLAGGGIVVQP